MTLHHNESLETQLEKLKSQLEMAKKRLHKQDAILSSVSDAILTTDMNGNLLSWNQGAERMYGWEAHEVLGKHVDTLLNRRHIGIEEEEVYRLFWENQTYEGEMIHTTKNGDDLYVLCSINLIFDQQGQPKEVVGINRDISKQRAAQLDSMRSEGRFRQLFDGFLNPVVIYDKDAVIHMINPFAAFNLGFQPEECIGKPLSDFMPETFDSMLHSIRKVLSEGKGFTTEDTVTLPNGDQRTFWSDFQPVYMNTGSPTMVQVVSYDMTERIQADQKTLESQIRLQALFDHSQDAIMLLDGDGLYIDVNPATEQLSGYTYNELIGQSFLTLIPKDYMEAVKSLWQRFSEEGEIQAELQLINKEQVLIDVEFNAVKSILPNIHLAIVRDVTERKQAQQSEIEAQQFKLELEKEKELRTLKTRFFSMVAHDFRTPLTVISTTIGMLERYRTKYTTDQIAGKYRQIMQQVHLLSAMVDDVSTINKHDLVGHDFKRAPINMRALVEQVIQDVQLTYVHETTVEIDIAPELDHVEMDKLLIHQILVNLVSNAIKYGQSMNSKMTITGCVQSNNMVLIVQDNGIGIPEKDQKYLFQVFHRASNAEHIPGNGLGLVIVKQAVEVHQGTIDLDSVEGKGTTFTITLPLAD